MPIEAKQLKSKFVEEMHRYLAYFIFIAILLSAFTDYERLLLAGTTYSYFPYGYSVIEAMILAKVIIIGEVFNIGERFANKSLIIPVLYKTIVFSFLVLFFSLLEHFILGIMKGETIYQVYEHFSGANLNIILSKTFILFFVFILFFSFLELNRVLGQDTVFNLFFRRNKINNS